MDTGVSASTVRIMLGDLKRAFNVPNTARVLTEHLGVHAMRRVSRPRKHRKGTTEMINGLYRFADNLDRICTGFMLFQTSPQFKLNGAYHFADGASVWRTDNTLRCDKCDSDACTHVVATTRLQSFSVKPAAAVQLRAAVCA